MLSEILQRIENPVPDHMSFTDYYEQIWETDEIMKVPIYGYFQFKSVQMALENREYLAAVLGEMGIHKEINNKPMVDVELVDDPSIHCANYIASLD